MTRTMMGGILFCTVAWTCWPAGAAAQDASAASARIVPGIVYQRAIFGDDAPRAAAEIGVSLGAQVCGFRSDARAFVTEGTLWTNTLDNPHYDERLRVLHLQAGPQFGAKAYVRATLGVAVQFWSHRDRRGTIDVALAGSLGVGRYLGAKRRVAAEGLGRLTVARGIATMSVTAQTPIGPCNR